MSEQPTTEQRDKLARECDRYAAHLTNRNAMLDAADLFARCAIALRAAPEPSGKEPPHCPSCSCGEHILGSPETKEVSDER